MTSTTTSARRRRPRSKSRAQQSQRSGRVSTAPRTSALESALDAAAARPAQPATFAQLGLPAHVVDRLTGLGIFDPTDAQLRTIPDAVAGRDILGRAQTGSGKTLAFGLPLVTRLADENRPAAPGYPRALVLAPTRELAQQVADAIESVGGRLSVLAIYGGASMDRQVKALRRGVDVVVATPGRLEDHLGRGTCDLSRVGIFVIDEADHMADLGFLPAVTRIFDAIPGSAQRLLFSATLDRGVEQLAASRLTDPAIHSATQGTPAAATMEHRAFTVEAHDKVAIAARVATRQGRTLFFVRTKHGADRLAKQLGREGIAAGSIHGNRSQSQRQRALAAFSSGHRPVLIATDVAARGIHVDDVDLVVHYDPPADHKDYLHRSGRTARAGNRGLVLSLLLPEQQRAHQQMHRATLSDHAAVAVHPGHPAVAELAGSGTPVVLRGEAPVDPPRQPKSPRSAGKRRPPRGGRGGSSAQRTTARPHAGRSRRG